MNNLVVAVLMYLVLFLIPIVFIVADRVPLAAIVRTLGSYLFIGFIVGAVLIAIGGLMSGRIGLIGNGIGAVFYYVWFCMMYAVWSEAKSTKL